VAGWLAHIQEQHADNRLIRPKQNYIGPKDRAFTADRPALTLAFPLRRVRLNAIA
jgi:hypothetical protein